MAANETASTAWRWALSADEEKAIQRRRSDLENGTLRSPIIVRPIKAYGHAHQDEGGASYKLGFTLISR